MNLDKNSMKKIAMLIAFAVLFSWVINNAGVFADVMRYLFGLITPFVIGAGIAFVVNAPMKGIEKGITRLSEKKGFSFLRKINRMLSIILTFVLIVVFILAVFLLIIPELGKAAMTWFTNMQPTFDYWQERAIKLAKDYPDLEEMIRNIDINWTNISQKAVGFLSAGAGSMVKSTVNVATTVVNGIVNVVLALIFAIYVLAQKERLKRQLKKLLYAYVKKERVNGLLDIMRLSNRTFSNFVTGQFLEACILGCMFFITMSILGIPYAIVVSVVIVITSLIPMVGAFIGCAFGAILIVLVNPMKALWFVIVFLVLQQIEGNIIYPRVVGNSVGLPAIWVLVAITVGGNMMGVIGMILFIPLCSVIYTILGKAVNESLRKKGIKVE